MRRLRMGLVLGVTAAVIASACTNGTGRPGETEDGVGDPGNCIVVDMVTSTEKADLVKDMAKAFNASGKKVNGKCVSVQRP